MSHTTFNGIQILDIGLHELARKIINKELPKSSYIVTPNADHFQRLENTENHKFISAYKAAETVVCDSRIIQKLSFFEKKRISNVVPGSDLTKHLLQSDELKNERILLIGPSESDASKIKESFGLKGLSHYSPPMGFINKTPEIEKCINSVLLHKPEYIFLAVGSPQQELLALQIKNKLRESPLTSYSLMLCIGASFDFLSGKTLRAPDWIQRAHLEWLHRALSDPARLVPRYAKNLAWIVRYLKRRVLHR